MDGIATTVNVYATCANGKPEGTARIVEVLKYLGDGWYKIKCVLRDDPQKRVVTRYCNIDEKP